MPNPYYIPVPKKRHISTKDRWDIVRACNGSRTKMVNWITDLGDYCRGYHDKYAIAFNVKAGGADLDADSLWELINSDQFDARPEPKKPEHMAVIRSLFDRVYAEHKEHLWEWAQEEAYEGWRDSDIPYETWTGRRIEWKPEVTGRCGGYIAMAECEGIDLRCSADELLEKLNEREQLSSNYSDKWGNYVITPEQVTGLFIICVQNYIELTGAKAEAEIEYRAAWRLWSSFVEPEIDAAVLEYETRERLTSDAETIREGLDLDMIDSFNAICRLAGINIEKE